MLRLVALSAMFSVVCVALGLGKIVPLASGVENVLLAMAALSATVLFSSYDAYETQRGDGDD